MEENNNALQLMQELNTVTKDLFENINDEMDSETKIRFLKSCMGMMIEMQDNIIFQLIENDRIVKPLTESFLSINEDLLTLMKLRKH